MDYRREVDGLRALAVLPVIFFHAGFTAFSGGFVGVDIFFVISGYLITTIIATELNSNSFSLRNFYERRARRILPVLFFVMLCTLPFAWAWMLPNALKDYSKSLIAVPLFGSNILFSLTSGYFDIASELKPLLHTWSLAVEEQYYAFFPLILMLFWRLGNNLITFLLIVTALISLLIAQWGMTKYSIGTFYLLPTRGFELIIGALISMHMVHKPNATLFSQPTNQLFSIGGLVLICYSIFAFDKSTPSPSVYSLIPTIGAGLIILFANDKNMVGQALGNKLFVGVGLISYSAYLWHQPIIAFSKLRSLFGLEAINPYNIVAASLFLAGLSWKFIEQPFRNKKIISSRSILVFSIVGTLAFIVLGGVIYLQDGFRATGDRVPPNIEWLSLSEKHDIKGDICKPVPYETSGIAICAFGDLSSNKNVVLYGDSHAQAISEQLSKAFSELKIKGIRIVIDGCEVVPEIRIYAKTNTDVTDNCISRFGNMLSYIKNHQAAVVVVSRWSFKLYPIKGQIDDMPSKNSEGGIENDVGFREYVAVANKKISFDGADKKIALTHFLDRLLSATDTLYLIYPIPETSWDIARKNISFYRTQERALQEISIPHSDFKTRNSFVNSIFTEYEKHPKVITIKPEDIFCNSYVKDRCVAQHLSIPYYYDDDHLSDIGASLVIEELKKQVK